MFYKHLQGTEKWLLDKYIQSKDVNLITLMLESHAEQCVINKKKKKKKSVQNEIERVIYTIILHRKHILQASKKCIIETQYTIKFQYSFFPLVALLRVTFSVGPFIQSDLQMRTL